MSNLEVTERRGRIREAAPFNEGRTEGRSVFVSGKRTQFLMDATVLGNFFDLCNNLKVGPTVWRHFRRQSELDGSTAT